ncbi:HEAT repeat domain-containing protein [Candidatus Poriferisodalis sp.]|uniref:HEAT repeat domain-containing protein n=1 Tax=Candidatus Poriferisodalis sp. TaxID=3101277 RepID=UPI003B027180
MGFKEDGDFARFVAMGAVGAATAADVLRDRYGHQPIEFERYAMANKVWQSKVKRLRLPDLLCVRCGLRVEARAKSKLGIVLSHSDTPGRRWDDGGMRDSDLYAFMRADSSGFPPVAAEPDWFTTAALRSSVANARRSQPKAASEGSEVTLRWPCWVPSYGGTFEGVDDQDRIVVTDDTGRRRNYWHWRNWTGPRYRYLQPGDTFEPDERIVAGIVEPPASLACPGETWNVLEAIRSPDPVERLGAVRALSVADRADMAALLFRVADDPHEDWRIQLEARAALARSDPDRWVPAITSTVDAATERERSMEAVLALAEVSAPAATHALSDIAAQLDLHEDVRAAAAWGVGQGAAADPVRLLPAALDPEPIVAFHAVAAIDTVTADMEATLLEWLDSGNQRKASTAANVLARTGSVDALLDAYEQLEQARPWALYALGLMGASAVRTRAAGRLTTALRIALEPMWLRELDWLNGEDDDPLAALDLQKIRFDPLHPTTLDARGVGAHGPRPIGP